MKEVKMLQEASSNALLLKTSKKINKARRNFMKYVKSLYVIAVVVCLILPISAFAQGYDLDIDDDLGNLVGNTMTMNLMTDPFITIDGTGQFWLVNPDENNNVDPDPYGNNDLNDIYYTFGDLNHITNYGAWIPSSNINIDLTTPYSLDNGDAVLVDLTVTVPTSQPEGQYETWVRVYDDEEGVEDSFKLRVIIGTQEDLDIRELTLAGTVGASNDLVQYGSFYVLNPNSASDNPDPDYPGNCDLFNLRFAAQNFINVADPTKRIEASRIFVSAPTVFGPTALPDARINQLVSGYDMQIIVWLDIPYGTPSGLYDGQIIVYDDDGWPADVIGLSLTVEESYDIDISDNTGNLVGNWMSLNNLPGTTVSGHFVLINPNNWDLNVDPDTFGNTDLTSIYYQVDELNHVTNPLQYIPASNVSLTITPPDTLLSGASVNVGLSVDIPADQFEGEYTAWVKVINTIGEEPITDVRDSFQLRVVVGPQEDIDFVQEEISGNASVGDTLVLLGQFEIINQDPTQWPWPDPDGPSNNDLYNLRFAVTHLMDSIQPSRTIPPSQIYVALTSAGVATGPVPVDQANINQLALGDTAYGKVWVYLPYGTRGATYTGTLQVYDDDGWPTDFLGLKLWVEPWYDIDISDNTGNLVGNWMSLSSGPGTTPNGHFILINPNNPDLNVDPDIFGNTDLFTIYYQIDNLNHITNPLEYIPSANITLTITDPDTLYAGGSDMVGLSVVIPPDQFEGEYATWVRVIDRTTGVADSFQLRVTVGPQEDIDFVQEEILGSSSAGDTLVLLGQFEIVNQDQSQWPWPDPDGPSNTDLYNLRFAVTHLMDSVQPNRSIPPSQIYLALTSAGVSTGPVPVDQANINQLALGDTAYGKVWVYLPYGTKAATYNGTLQVYDDDGWPTDFLGLSLLVEPSYDIDISDNTGNLDANWMTLNNLPGITVNGHFILINPNKPALNVDPDIYGNTDLTTIYYDIDNLVHKYNPIHSIPSSDITLSITDPFTLLTGGSEMVDLWVAIPADQYMGEYEGWVRVIDRTTGVADSFQLKVVVGPQEDIDFVQEEISGSAAPGDSLVFLGQFELVNQDQSQWPWPDPDGPSNNDLYNLRFAVTHLMDSVQLTRTIPPSQIYVALTSAGVATGPVPIDQANINQLALGDTAYGKVWVYLPYGTRGATYTGTLQVYDDDGWPTDFLGLKLWVEKWYDLDIADNQQNLIGNKMNLAGPMNATTQTGYFRMINPNTPELNVDPDHPGNADFTSFNLTVSNLNYVPVPGSDISYVIPNTAVIVILPSGLANGDAYNASVSVAIPADVRAGTYRGTVTVTGVPSTPGTPTDMFDLEVVVGAIDDIDIAEASVTGGANHGLTANTGNFTVWSTDAANNPDAYDGPGNTTLYGVTFSVEDLRYGNNVIPASNVSFVPAMIDSIRPGTSKTVYAKVNIPFGTLYGMYTGLASATNNTGTTSDTVRIKLSVFPLYDLDISDNEQNLIGNMMYLSGPMGTTRQGTFRMVNPNAAEMNVDPDQYGNADFTGFTSSIDNLTYVPFGDEDINYTIPSSAVTLTLPTGLASGVSYDARAQVVIPMNTFSGVYRGMVRIIGAPPSNTYIDSFVLQVSVGPLDDIDITEPSVAGSGDQGTLVTTSNFTVWSTDASNNPDAYDGPGNTTLYGITFSSQDLRFGSYIIPAANVSFVPNTIDSLRPATSRTVLAKVNVPFGVHNGLYTGIATAINSTGTTSDTVRINVTVNAYYDLDISDNEQNLIGNMMYLSGPMGTTRQGNFRMVNPNTAELNVDPDQYGNADFTNSSYTVDTLKFVPFGNEDILYYIPPSAVTVTIPTGLASGTSADARVQVSIPMNTFNGVYRGKVIVRGVPNTNTYSDTFLLQVSVGPLDDIDITEPSVAGSGDQGTLVTTSNFTVWSTDASNNPDAYDGPGNTTLYGITFSSQDLRYGTFVIPAANVSFVPNTIDSLRPATSRTVLAKVNVPYGVHNGLYTGLATAINNTGTTSDTVRINVTVNAYYDLDIADNEQNLVGNIMHLAGPMGQYTQNGYFRLINPNSAALNVDPDQYGNADFTSLNYTVTNLLYVPVPGSDISYMIPSIQAVVVLPATLASGASLNCLVQVGIPANTFAGTYRGRVVVNGYPATPGTASDTFTLEVLVGAVDDLDIAEASVSATGDHGTTVNTTNFHVWSTDADLPSHNPDTYDGPGNTTLYGITFSSQDLRFGTYIIPAANVSFVPNNIDSLPPGQSRTVLAKVNVPYGIHTGLYTGLATAINNTGTTSDTVRINVTVNPYYDLDIADNQQNLIGNRLSLSGPMGTTRQGTFRMVNPNSAELNVDPDQYGNADFTSFTSSIDNLIFIPFGDLSDISYTIPSSAVTLTLPSGLVSGASYDARAQVVIPMNTFSGVYRGIVRIIGTPSLNTYIDSFVLQVSVGPLDDIDITEPSVSATTNHGTSVWTSPFTVWSTDAANNPDAYDGPGNTTLYGITFASQDLRAGNLTIPASNVEFLPTTIDSLRPAQSRTVRAKVNVPYGTYATIYSGIATATNNTGTTSDTVRIYVTVLPSYDIDISDNTGNLVQNWMTLSVTPLPNVSFDSAYFVAINPNSPDLNVDPDMYGNYDLTNVRWSVQDLVHLTDPLAYIPKESVMVYMPSPDFIGSGAWKSYEVKVSVPEFQFAGDYNTWLKVYDSVYSPEDNGYINTADSFQLKVVVRPIEDIDIIETQISQTVNTGDTLVYIGQYTVVNPDPFYNPDPDYPSNIDLNNLRFTCENLREIGTQARYIPAQNIFVEMVGSSSGPTPVDNSYIAELPLGQSQDVKVWALVPRGTYGTTYRGEMRVIDDDGYPSDVIAIQIIVNKYYDLDISDNEQNLAGNKMSISGAMGSVHQRYFRMINPNTGELNVDPDIYGNADFTSFTSTVDTLKYIPFGDEDILYYIPPSAVTLTLPGGLASGASSNARVQVNIPMNTFTGTYRGKVRVTGVPTLNTHTDTFTLEVFVGPYDDIDIDSAMVHATTNHGTTVNTTQFRVYSTDAAVNPDPDGPGNTTLYGITFSSADLRNGDLLIPAANVQFVPTMIESIKPAQSYPVYARVNVPFGTFATTYSGIVTATNNTGTTSDTVRIYVTVNPYYDLDIADNEQNLTSNKMALSGPMGAVRIGNFRMINPNTADLNVDPDQYGNANFTSFTSSVDTLRYIPFGDEDILYYIPPSAVTLTLPSGLASGASTNARVQVSIPMNTFTGIYRGKVIVTGVPTLNTHTDTFMLEVYVGPLDDIDITEPSVSGSGNHGTIVPTSNFTVWSTDVGEGHNPDAYDGPGNTTLYGITFSSQDLRFGNFVIPGANVSFVPITIESLPPGQSRTVQAQVTVPYGVHNGLYTGLATAINNTGTTSDTVRINITVNALYDLDIADNAQGLVGNKMSLIGSMNSMTDSAFFLIVNPNSADLNVDPDMFGNADFTSLAFTATELTYIPIPGADIIYTIPSTAVSVTLPSGLVSGASANGKVKVSIPADRRAGTYRGKVWVTGTPTLNTHTDTFTLEVVVRPVEDLDIAEASVSKSGAHGTTAITNSFRVWSTDGVEGHNPDPDGPGNTTLYGINFITNDLRFGERVIPAANVEVVPTNIDSLRPGEFKACSVKVFIPYGTHDGLYTGLVTAQNNTGSTSDTVRIRITVTASYDLDIADNQQNLVSNKMNLAGPMGATRQGFFRMVNPNNPEMNIDPDMYGNADFTSFTYIVDTLRYVPSADEDIMTYILPGAVTLTLPSGLVSGGSYDAKVSVLIPMNTLTGTYRGYVTVTGAPGEPGTPTDMFVLEVVVGPLEDLDIEQASVQTGGLQGTTVTTTPFKVWSTDASEGHNPDAYDGPGNITLYGINFIAQDLRLGTNLIPAANIQFTPATIASLYPGTYESVRASVNIPYGAYAGTYSGLATAQNNSGSVWDTVRIYVIVESEFDLDIADNMAGLVTNKMTLRLVPNFSATNDFLLVNPDRPANNYDPDPYGNADLTGLQYKVSTTLYSPGDYYQLLGSDITFSNNPTDLAWGAGVNVCVSATIDPLQPYATYYGTVTVYKLIYEQSILADSFMLEVQVGPRDIFSMPDTITIFGYAGTLADTSFYVMNTGNKTIERIELFPMTDFFSAGGVRIPKEQIQFTPPILIDSMRIGESTEVTARVDIPRATLPTSYIAKAKAMQQRGDPAKNFIIKLNVIYQTDISEGIVFSDNPVTGAYVDIACWGTEPKLTLMNMAAEIVQTANSKDMTNGVYRWHLTNTKGKPVASGMYVAIVQTTIDQKAKTFTKKLLIVK